MTFSLELGSFVLAVFLVVVWAVRLEGVVKAHTVKDEVIQQSLHEALTRIEGKLDAVSAQVGLQGLQGLQGVQGLQGRRGARGRTR